MTSSSKTLWDEKDDASDENEEFTVDEIVEAAATEVQNVKNSPTMAATKEMAALEVAPSISRPASYEDTGNTIPVPKGPSHDR
jgi:hypothetical protein